MTFASALQAQNQQLHDKLSGLRARAESDRLKLQVAVYGPLYPLPVSFVYRLFMFAVS